MCQVFSLFLWKKRANLACLKVSIVALEKYFCFLKDGGDDVTVSLQIRAGSSFEAQSSIFPKQLKGCVELAFEFVACALFAIRYIYRSPHRHMHLIAPNNIQAEAKAISVHPFDGDARRGVVSISLD